MSAKQIQEITAKLLQEKNMQQEEIKRRKEVVTKLKRQIHWLVSENIKQKQTFEVWVIAFSKNEWKHRLFAIGFERSQSSYAAWLKSARTRYYAEERGAAGLTNRYIIWRNIWETVQVAIIQSKTLLRVLLVIILQKTDTFTSGRLLATALVWLGLWGPRH